MKKYTVIAICLFLFLNACSPKNQYNYAVHLSENEMILLKNYMKKYNDLNNKIYIHPNFVYSNEIEILHILKLKTKGIINHHTGIFTPIIINYNEKYYLINDCDKLKETNWLKNDEIFMNLSDNDFSLIEIDIPEYMKNLSKDEFIENYLERKENHYISKIKKGPFNDENTKLYGNIFLLSQIKYGFIVTHYEWNDTEIEDVIIINNNE
jgi:hypothetical protein